MAWVGAMKLGVWGSGRVGLGATGVDIGAVWGAGSGLRVGARMWFWCQDQVEDSRGGNIGLGRRLINGGQDQGPRGRVLEGRGRWRADYRSW